MSDAERLLAEATPLPPRTEAGRNFLSHANLMHYEEDIEASDQIMAAVVAVEDEVRAAYEAAVEALERLADLCERWTDSGRSIPEVVEARAALARLRDNDSTVTE